MCLYVRKTDISPMFNGEVVRLCRRKTGISPIMYNGEVGAYKEDSDISPVNIGEVDASVHKEDCYLTDVQRRGTCVCI